MWLNGNVLFGLLLGCLQESNNSALSITLELRGPHCKKPMAICILFVLCITRDLSFQCLSRCPGAFQWPSPEEFDFKSNGSEAKAVLYFVRNHILEPFLCQTFRREITLHKFEIYFVYHWLLLFLLNKLFSSFVAIFQGHPTSVT